MILFNQQKYLQLQSNRLISGFFFFKNQNKGEKKENNETNKQTKEEKKERKNKCFSISSSSM